MASHRNDELGTLGKIVFWGSTIATGNALGLFAAYLIQK